MTDIFDLFSSFLICLLYKSRITFLTEGPIRSLCRHSLVTYHGVFAIPPNIFDRILWVLLMFDSLAAPQVWHEYDHIGLRIDLYNSTLLFKASCEFLPSNQYILLYLIFISFLFFSMWFFHVSLWSRCIPRHLTELLDEICLKLKYTGGLMIFLFVNEIWVDFASLTCIRHLWN